MPATAFPAAALGPAGLQTAAELAAKHSGHTFQDESWKTFIKTFIKPVLVVVCVGHGAITLNACPVFDCGRQLVVLSHGPCRSTAWRTCHSG
jgi:hypothetical protein